MYVCLIYPYIAVVGFVTLQCPCSADMITSFNSLNHINKEKMGYCPVVFTDRENIKTKLTKVGFC